ncbi:MAG: hypothetical protein JST58_10300 [Bacteroidetes bacterium]|nr:hypothetical protein [Bacteroidota bacterium]
MIDIHYKGALLELPSELLLQGYTHKVKVMLGANEVFFEKDEEDNYRALLLPGQEKDRIDMTLVSLVGKRIEELFA